QLSRPLRERTVDPVVARALRGEYHPMREFPLPPNAGDDLTVRCGVKRHRPMQQEAGHEQQDAVSEQQPPEGVKTHAVILQRRATAAGATRAAPLAAPPDTAKPVRPPTSA